jgi:hypothetical protein
LPETKDGELRLVLRMNILLYVLGVDLIGLVEILANAGVKCLVLANLQYGKNFSSDNKTIGVVGGEISGSRIINNINVQFQKLACRKQ